MKPVLVASAVAGAIVLTAVLSVGPRRASGEIAVPATAVVTPAPAKTGETTVDTERVLRVCSDPNNLPFSNEREEGFENRIAELVARDLGVRLEYFWWAQRRGFIRNTLKQGRCDLVIGIPSSFELAMPTIPYYRSSYVFVYPEEEDWDVTSFDDELLRELKIGVLLIGDDYTNTPPAHALANRGIIDNIVGYTIYGDYREETPPSRIIDALSSGEIDIAVVWGPLAGYFAPRQPMPLKIVPVSPQLDLPFLPFVYDIAMGVRRGEDEFKARVENVIRNRRGEIAAILQEYGVPMVGEPKRGSK